MIKRGVPTVLLISENFVETAKTLARVAGVVNLPIVVFPPEVDNLPREQVISLLEERLADITGRLIEPFAQPAAAPLPGGGRNG
jgi:hypothetical protein